MDEVRTTAESRGAFRGHTLRLEYLKVDWNVVEGFVAIMAAVAAGSIGLASASTASSESTSGGILNWRLLAVRKARDPAVVGQLDRRARQLVALALLALAGYVFFDSASSLWKGHRPSPSIVGIAVTSISIGVLGWLVRAKRQAAVNLGSRALAADSHSRPLCAGGCPSSRSQEMV